MGSEVSSESVLFCFRMDRKFGQRETSRPKRPREDRCDEHSSKKQ